jgi:hypothetical protein
MPTEKKVEYRGRHLGDLRVFSVEDWQNKDRPATEKDLRLMNATSAADLVFAVLRREPLKVSEEEPDKPWVVVVLREVCAAAAGMRDGRMEEQVLMLYVSRNGMNQILEIWGADVGRLQEEIGRMSGVDDDFGES